MTLWQKSGLDTLDSRLRAVARAVRPGAVAADVGTDHGYLICALVADGVCPRGYAADINPQPLDVARRHIREQGLTQRIETVLSDGLTALPGGEIDDVILAGMGGMLISDILAACPWVKDPQKRFLLQPMTRAAQLRRFLYREGFALTAEEAVASGRFVYSVMTAVYTGECRDIDECFAQTGLLWERDDPAARAYLARAAKRLHKQAAGLAKARDDTGGAAELLALADSIAERAGKAIV